MPILTAKFHEKLETGGIIRYFIDLRWNEFDCAY